ncbi:CaiB/BaiF CoA-transferase family protein [Streptomyces sp. TLI_146]|uniref:CaiB/BaiF CoA transferase family protein n=1 Tax=Streptomyces sp. TLI_146 TaxID=1938858 RepID=UPI000C70E658|nr:CoA transferase [Streptomyces sp. TLI_146]PKV90120.1 crotonobetainyl-CoA:carnitine CoA-transferase CaiB-like acyl-CoA transferase [Streptomyces sp. TLI_146]
MSENPSGPSGRGLLAGVRVVELASVIMGPYAAQQLGDLGADVIKVEPPTGDMTRHYPPRRHPGMGGPALNLNRNKRSAAIDLKAPNGRDALLALLRTADVLITNLRPQALEKLRLGYDDVKAVNPGLIYANAQGFRSDSRYGTHAAYDDIIQAASGLVWLNHQVSGQPHYVPTVLADKICGMQIVQSVLAALHYREHGGTGQHIEVPMADTMLAFNLVEHLGAAALDTDGEFGSPRSLSPERRALRTADGWMCILPHSDRNWRDFTDFVHRPELAADPRFATGPDRARNANAFYPLLAELTRHHTSAEWQDFCDWAGIAAAPVLDLEAAATTAYAQEGGLLYEAEHPTEGRYRVIGRPVRYSADPEPELRPCPRVGQHTDEVLREAGFDPSLLHPAN